MGSRPQRWHQFTLAGLFALTTVAAILIALVSHWNWVVLVLLIPIASVMLAAPVGVPLYFIGTMLNDKKTCTPRFLLAFLICECAVLGIIAAPFLLSFVLWLIQVPRD
jgi:hypothetical protein